MKKIFILVLTAVFAFCSYYFLFGVKKTSSIVYPYERWSEGFTRFYTDKMKDKYPDIEDIKLDSYRLETNEEGLRGVYENETDKLVIPQEYKTLEACRVPYNMFFNTGDTILDYKNNIVFKSGYDCINCSSFEGGIKTQKSDKLGVVFYDGNEVLKPEFDDIQSQENFAYSGGFYYIVKKDNQYGVFDNKGNEIIPLQDKVLMKAGTAAPFFIIEENYKKGIIDIYGNIVVRPKYQSLEFKTLGKDFLRSYFVACNDKKCGTLDLNGNKELPFKYANFILKLNDKHFAVGRISEKMDIIDIKGKKKTKQSYNLIWRINDKYACVFKTGKGIGVVDYNGKLLLKPTLGFNEVTDVAGNGLIKISNNGLYGIIYKGKIIVAPKYPKIYFHKGHVLILFEKDGKHFYYVSDNHSFTKSGFDVDSLPYYKNNTFKNVNNKCFRLIDNNHNDIVFCE